jgi:predicted enzyme related to lactoylglutathione lyase
MMPLPPGGHPAWNIYFGCEDADATMAGAGDLGGATVMGPIDVPSGTRFAILRDPTNAVFSVAAGPMDP